MFVDAFQSMPIDRRWYGRANLFLSMTLRNNSIPGHGKNFTILTIRSFNKKWLPFPTKRKTSTSVPKERTEEDHNYSDVRIKSKDSSINSIRILIDMEFVSDCSVISAWRFSSSSISHFSHDTSLRNLLFRWSSIDTNLPSSKLFSPSRSTSNITCLSLCWSITGEQIHGRLDKHVLSSNFFRCTNSFQIHPSLSSLSVVQSIDTSRMLPNWSRGVFKSRNEINSTNGFVRQVFSDDQRWFWIWWIILFRSMILILKYFLSQ